MLFVIRMWFVIVTRLSEQGFALLRNLVSVIFQYSSLFKECLLICFVCIKELLFNLNFIVYDVFGFCFMLFAMFVVCPFVE